MFDRDFITSSQESRAALDELLGGIVELLVNRSAVAYSGRPPAELERLLDCNLGAGSGDSVARVLERLAAVVENSINVDNPRAIAHLHCATVVPAIAAELLIGALNPSMDSFDQAPAATMIELQLLRYLCARAGFTGKSGGTFTPGATQSNFFGLLLAREAAFAKLGISGWHGGVGGAAGSLRIVCSRAAHFSVEKSAAQLGLGTQAVVRVDCDERFRMSIPALRATLEQVVSEGRSAMAIVATAGTTDFGSIDPLGDVAELAREYGAWLHVDAAYGGALLFSRQHKHKLRGMDQADSVSIDFHKLLWQPIGCGAFLLRDAGNFERVKMHADYLNPEDHEEAGVPDLVTRSLLTSRRFDALKLWVSLQLLGERRIEAMIDQTLALASEIASYIETRPELQLLHSPEIGCVVFRYSPEAEGDGDRINQEIRRGLFESGAAVLGQTRLHDRVCLKMTCLNPRTKAEQLRELVDEVVARGAHLEQDQAPIQSS